MLERLFFQPSIYSLKAATPSVQEDRTRTHKSHQASRHSTKSQVIICNLLCVKEGIKANRLEDMIPSCPVLFAIDVIPLTFQSFDISAQSHFIIYTLNFGASGMLPAAGAVPSGPHPVKAPEIQPDQLLKVHAPATSLGTCSASGMQPGATSGHSSKSSAENFSLPLAQGAPSKNISCLDAGLPEGQDDFSDMSDSSATITYMDASVNSSDDSDKGSVVLPPKRCRGSKRSRMPLSSAPVENMPKPNLTVIFKPQNPEQIITRFNPLTLKAAFEAVVPDGVLQVRPNERLNLLAVDTRSAEVSVF